MADVDAEAAKAGEADTAEAAAEAEPATEPDAPAIADPATGALATTPNVSSDGTFSTAPSRMRLGSCPMNAFGLASKIAFDARAKVARSCDCVSAIAMSFSD